MGYGRLSITGPFLAELLKLPAGSNIIAAECNLDTNFNVELVVSHEGITGGPAPGVKCPVVRPSFRQQEPIVFEEWNQE